ncbi:hypothetical protein F4703DRAFT_1840580 [Phycomyces blakesleeanus]|uniref:Uncharacterized protein n=1 Tax=Phycomyces blakesleeanus (strain ATCC 8743b / DSM 1359 / FGSC 10004 / NBRC 33097 / NRRL 1555) TaxID=763407 RepID=A0A163A071_PHYB8|nr:hypothetical protein PHYBLDRAFT_171547 [Phycomyces blakesleeanus NRRL 1555(-)]OAD70161.1 hypothetical protein PHYBLDRAFT_171547 [Phycomyces blakesleeanus NRRL 1555(-)]|eukprot:XP_018288201.1 hypothetical protein PHYBLDRAFT_171547 [Phycomyces blakesleeanus NRRL 1555(-)]
MSHSINHSANEANIKKRTSENDSSKIHLTSKRNLIKENISTNKGNFMIKDAKNKSTITHNSTPKMLASKSNALNSKENMKDEIKNKPYDLRNRKPIGEDVQKTELKKPIKITGSKESLLESKQNAQHKKEKTFDPKTSPKRSMSALSSLLQPSKRRTASLQQSSEIKTSGPTKHNKRKEEELPFAPDGLDFEPITSFDKLSSELTFKTSDEKFLNTTTFEYGSPPTDPDTQHNSARSKAEDDFDFPLDVETGHHEEKELPFELDDSLKVHLSSFSPTISAEAYYAKEEPEFEFDPQQLEETGLEIRDTTNEAFDYDGIPGASYGEDFSSGSDDEVSLLTFRDFVLTASKLEI